jgi:hypothetical protein
MVSGEMLGASDEFPTCPDILAENGGASPDLGPRKPPLRLVILINYDLTAQNHFIEALEDEVLNSCRFRC